MGESATISLLCQTFPHFHTSEKCGTKDEKESRDLVASTGHLCLMCTLEHAAEFCLVLL